MIMSEENRTELSDLGEFGLINSIKKNVKIRNKSTLKGIGDDAAVIKYDSDSHTVLSTDLLVEGVHFDLSYVPLKHLGYKAVMVNLSDIIAMNAIPRQITISLSLSNRFSLEAVEEIYEGVHLACELYNVDLIGGDTASSISGLTISVTAIGEGKEGKLVYRDGVKESNLLVVSGDLGGAYMGLQILEREKQIYEESPGVQPDLSDCDYILERQLKPEARLDIIREFETLGVQPKAMMDISDGLSSEVIHLCKQSAVGVSIYEDKLPIDQQTFDRARDNNLDPTMCALNGGEDYELVFAIDLGDYEKIKNHPMFTIVGHFVAESDGYTLTAKDGSSHPLEAQGWNALKD
jgi:thiamine-monophosphate kinase